MNCTYCEKVTNNPKFCSRSCAASFNNLKQPKRKPIRKCLECDSPPKSWRHNRCEEHWKEYQEQKLKFKNMSVGEYRDKLSVKGKHPSWINAHVRNFARSWFKHLTKLPCHNCGYSKHVELCHIKPVSSFPDETLLKEVNSEPNIIQLCRNCHWEFDNGLLEVLT